jgi:hypothetical protein
MATHYLTGNRRRAFAFAIIAARSLGTVEVCMSTVKSNLLQRALQADGVISGATGVLMLALAEPLSGLLGLPPGLLRGAGAALLPFALFVWWLSAQPAVSRRAAWAVVVINALWTADSIWLLLSGHVAPTGLGTVYVIGQAAIVLLFAELQYVGLRRSRLVAG